MSAEDKENKIMEIFKPYSSTTIEIKNGNDCVDNLKSVNNSKFSLISTDFAILGNIRIEFHSFETNEMHPLESFAKCRQGRIALKCDVKSRKVS